MVQQNLVGIQLAAALSEAVYRRGYDDLPISLSDDLNLDTLDFGNLLPVPSGIATTTDTEGTRFYYSPRGFCAMVVEKNGQYWITFRGTDSAESFASGAAESLGQPQMAVDPDRLTDIGDWVNNRNLGFGTSAQSQLDDALALTQAVINNLADGDRSKVVVAGQSLGGGLASLVSAVENVKAYAIAPAPFKDQLDVEATFAALAQVGITRTAAEALPTEVQNGLITRDEAFESGGSVLDVYLQYATSLSATQRSQVISAHTSIRATYDTRLQTNLEVHKLTGEVLNDGIGGNAWLVGVDSFTNNVTAYDVGEQASSMGGLTDNTAVSLHSPALHNLVIRTETETQKFSTLMKDDAALRDGLLEHEGISGSIIGARADYALNTALYGSSGVASPGPSPFVLERALWKTVGESQGLYQYFYKVFHDLLNKGAAADGLSATVAPGEVPTAPTLHAGVVRLALGVLRDLLQNTTTIPASALTFAGGSSAGSAFNDKIVIDKTILDAGDVAAQSSGFAALRKDPTSLRNWGVGEVEAIAFKAAADVVTEYGGDTHILDSLILDTASQALGADLKLTWKVLVVQAGAQLQALQYDATSDASAKLFDNATFVKDASHLIFGGDWRDDITGSTADDVIIGGASDDRIEGRQGKDVIIGGVGVPIDTASYANSTGAVTINFSPAQSSERQAGILRVTNDGFGAAGSEDILIGIERIELTKQATRSNSIQTCRPRRRSCRADLFSMAVTSWLQRRPIRRLETHSTSRWLVAG